MTMEMRIAATSLAMCDTRRVTMTDVMTESRMKMQASSPIPIAGLMVVARPLCFFII